MGWQDEELKVVDLEPPPRTRRFPWRRTIFVAIVGISAGAFFHSRPDPPEPPPAPRLHQPARIPRTGHLTLVTSPPGAVIHLDGHVMGAVDGYALHPAAVTPADLHSLLYGRRYVIELRKPGYEPFRKAVIMDGRLDGGTIHAVLRRGLMPEMLSPEAEYDAD